MVGGILCELYDDLFFVDRCHIASPPKNNAPLCGALKKSIIKSQLIKLNQRNQRLHFLRIFQELCQPDIR